ncbi:MAG: hypothetical protein ACE5EX_05830 [Phycisphaerae bacterium]
MSTRCTRLAVSVIGLPIAFGLTGLAGCGGMQEPPAEALLPEVVDVRALSSNQIVVEFTEPVGPEADLVSSYVVRGPDSELLAVRAVEVNTARTTATLTTDDQQADTDYVLEFAGSPFGVQTFDVQTFSPPRVVGAVSTSNTTVVLTFNKNMGPSASVAANYVIVQEDVNAEAIALSVMSAAFVASQQDAVELTTVSQSEVTYRVRAVNVLDLMGSQLAPSEGGVEPDTTTFAGTPFSCGGVPCDAPDADGDGVSDAEEQLGYLVTLELMNGQLDEFEVTSDPFSADTDGDGLDDAEERSLASNPRSADTDRDGMSDAAEEDPVSGGWDVETFDINGVAEAVEHVFSSKFVADTDFDGLPDLLERELRTNPTRADTDGDGLDDFDEFAQFASFINLNDIFPGFVLDGTESLRVGTSPLRDDTDGDQLGDLFEATGGWTVLVNGETRMVTSNPLVGDTDTDGATDKEEFLGEDGAPPPASTDATDPNDPDTDGDGAFDGAELEPGGSDPLVRDLIVGVRIIGLVVHENAAPEDLQVLWAWKFTAEIPSVSPEPVEFSSSNEYQTCFPLCPGSSNCCAEHIGFGCDSTLCRESVCAQDPLCCFILWDNACVNLAESLCGSFFGSEPSCQPSTGLIFDAAGSNDQILVFDDLVDFTDECGGHEVLFALSEGQAIRLNFKLTSPVSAALCDPAFQPSECSVSVNEVRSFEQLLEAPNWQEVVVDLGEGSPFACSDSSATIAIIRH